MSVRLAAWIVQQGALDGPAKNVLALELGHSVGPQVLSIWLPRAKVYTANQVFGPHKPAGLGRHQADVVVLGVPGLRHICFVLEMLRDDRLDRRIMQDFWSRRDADPHDTIPYLVQAADAYLKLGGVLVIIGAVQEGEHHVANKEVRRLGTFKPLVIKRGKQVADTTQRPVEVVYSKRPWCPFGVLPSQDRLLSAWRRTG